LSVYLTRIVKHKLISVITLLFLLLLPVTAYANSPAPPSRLMVYVTGRPQNTRYADILIQLPTDDANYIVNSDAMFAQYPSLKDSEISTYEQDGYRSYTFHFLDANADMMLSGTDYTETSGFAAFAEEHYDSFIEQYTKIKVVLLDENGNILDISPTIDISDQKQNTFWGSITYDASEETVDISYYDSPYTVLSLLYFLIIPFGILIWILFRIIFSVGAEVLIAIPFKVKPLWKVMIVNLATQIFLTAGMRICTFDYALEVAVFEVLVVVIEFFAFRLLMKNISVKRLALFVLVANLITLGFGLLLNSIGIFQF